MNEFIGDALAAFPAPAWDRGGVEYRRAELRYDGERTVSGVAVRYGDRAEIAGAFSETIAPGAFTIRGGVTLNLQHRRELLLANDRAGLTLRDNDRQLSMRADLPKTRLADDVLEAVRAGLYGGLSVEMAVEREEWDGDHRTVHAARLGGVAIVDRPAYPESTLDALRAAAYAGRDGPPVAGRPPSPLASPEAVRRAAFLRMM